MDFEATSGIYKMHWPQENISIRIERIKESSSRGIRGEVWVSNHNDTHPHVHQAEINLMATRSRADIAKHAKARFPELDWTALVEQACVAVIQHWRRGEPAINLRTLPREEGLRHRMELVGEGGLLFEGQPNLTFGDGGLGKSLWATFLSVLISGGVATDRLVPEPGNCLYLDYEASPGEVQDRYAAIASGLQIEPPNLYYRFCHQPVAAEIEQLHQLVAENDIKFIVVDSAAAACGSKPEEAESAVGFFTALRSLKVTSLTIAHTSKAGGGKAGPFGSVFWNNYPRSVWESKRAQGMGADSIEFALWHRKVNSGPLLKPLAYQINFAQDEIVFENMKVEESDALSQDLSVPERIRLALKDGSMSANDLAAYLEVNLDVVKVTLSRGKKRFVQVGEHQWGNLAQTPVNSQS